MQFKPITSSRALTSLTITSAQVLISLLLLVEPSISQYYFSVSSTITCSDVQSVGEISRGFFKDTSFYYETITSLNGYAAVLKYPLTGTPTLEVSSSTLIFYVSYLGRICAYSRWYISEGYANSSGDKLQSICEYEQSSRSQEVRRKRRRYFSNNSNQGLHRIHGTYSI